MRATPSLTSRARCDAGKSFTDSVSSTSAISSSDSKNPPVQCSGHERTILRSVFGEESVIKRDSSSRAGRTLQRPPPLSENLAATVFCTLDKNGLSTIRRCEDRRHGSSCTSTDYGNTLWTISSRALQLGREPLKLLIVGHRRIIILGRHLNRRSSQALIRGAIRRQRSEMNGCTIKYRVALTQTLYLQYRPRPGMSAHRARWARPSEPRCRSVHCRGPHLQQLQS